MISKPSIYAPIIVSAILVIYCAIEGRLHKGLFFAILIWVFYSLILLIRWITLKVKKPKAEQKQ